MNKVFIVVDMSEGMRPGTIFRVFADREAAVYYGEGLVVDGVIDEFDVYEREVY